MQRRMNNFRFYADDLVKLSKQHIKNISNCVNRKLLSTYIIMLFCTVLSATFKRTVLILATVLGQKLLPHDSNLTQI